jgi:hypothetical protein
MNNSTNANDEKWSQLIAKCWMDPQFQARLVREPQAVLAEAGITVPKGVNVKVIADTATQRTIVIPPAPAAGAVQDPLQSRKAAAMLTIVF